MENKQGVRREGEPAPLDKSGLVSLAVNADQANALQINAEQRYYAAMNTYEANRDDPRARDDLYRSASTAASYCMRAADANTNFYQAQSRSMVDDAKHSMLSEIAQVKVGKKDHDY